MPQKLTQFNAKSNNCDRITFPTHIQSRVAFLSSVMKPENGIGMEIKLIGWINFYGQKVPNINPQRHYIALSLVIPLWGLPFLMHSHSLYGLYLYLREGSVWNPRGRISINNVISWCGTCLFYNPSWAVSRSSLTGDVQSLSSCSFLLLHLLTGLTPAVSCLRSNL